MLGFKSSKMLASKVLRAPGCASCRLLLLRGLISVSSISLRVQHPPRSSLHPIPYQGRFHSSLRSRQRDGLEDVEHKPTEEVSDEIEAGRRSKDSTEASTIPWYLQVQPPQNDSKTLSERQRIPDLPSLPPPILQPLLQQVSIDLGFDDLTLLDLRKLDPPPALGANLIMVLGTARSEKHLYVSADRLCRWLRSEHKLRPDADGLLGRNELKLKLRRKAKRAKLMGNAMVDNTDDGVRTGWVCVDVGVVESAGDEYVAIEPKDFVGFGREVDGVRIVVQMLTEEKRKELELERLWGGILKRSGQQDVESDAGHNIEVESFDSRLPEFNAAGST